MACSAHKTTSDDIQQKQQEAILAEGTSAVGMPAIHNFREKKLAKDILEMRDQDGFITYTYLWSEYTGKYTFFCNSVGFALPYSTQYTNPEKVETYYYDDRTTVVTLPQADPNGLFSGVSEGTWVMCLSSDGKNAEPVYVEPRIITSPFKLYNPGESPESVAK